MDPLELAAASAVVSALATDGWQQARDAVVRLWRRARPAHVAAIESDLDDTRAELTDAPGEAAEQGLVADWERKLRRLVAADPSVALELRRVLDEELTPLLPSAEQERIRVVQNITADAPGAVAQGVAFGNLINHGQGPGPAGELR
jgi:hypothetical protein